jgi:hypothetical protein
MAGSGVISIPCSDGESLRLDFNRMGGTLVDRYASSGLNPEALQAAYDYGYRTVEPGGMVKSLLHGRSIAENLNRAMQEGWCEDSLIRLRGLFVRVKDGEVVDFGIQKGHCEVAFGMRRVAGAVMTNHAIDRANTRGIGIDRIEAALSHGDTTNEKGALRFTLTRNAASKAKHFAGVDVDAFLGTVVVTADHESADKVAHKVRREAVDHDGVALSSSELQQIELESKPSETHQVVITVYINRELSSRGFKVRPNRRSNGYNQKVWRQSRR